MFKTTVMSFFVMQDTSGAGNFGGSLVFSTASPGLTGSLQDWLTIASTGMSTFSGELVFILTNSTVKLINFN